MDSPDYGGCRASTDAEAALFLDYARNDPARTPVSYLPLLPAPMRSDAESHTGNRIKGFLYLKSIPAIFLVNSLTKYKQEARFIPMQQVSTIGIISIITSSSGV